jgi:excisionase family DNA binding protein
MTDTLAHDHPRLLDTATAASEARVGQAYIRRMISTGRIDAFRLGGNWVIERESWELYLKSRRGRGRPRR